MNPPPFARRRGLRCAAFTLVELLVVVGIVGVLVSMLMPALSKVKHQAAAVQCQSNLKQFMVAYLLYADGNHGKSFIYRENLDDYWIDALRPYHSDVDALRRCPVADDPPVSASGWGTSTQYWTRKVKVPPGAPELPVREGGYGFNGWLYRLAGANHPDGPEVDGGLKYSRGEWTVEQAIDRYVRPNAKESTRIPVFGDCIYPNGWPREMDVPPGNLMTGRKLFRPAPNEHMMVRFTIARHGKAINVGFLDGHAERVPLERMKMLKWHEDFQYDETGWAEQLPRQ